MSDEKPLSTDPAAGLAASAPAAAAGPKMSAAKPQRAFGQTEIAFPDRLSPEATREDNSLFGMPPEFAALSGLAIGRAIGNSALSAAGRAVAGLKAAAGSVTPVLKYEATRTALKAAGVPDGLASAAAVVVAGYKRGSAAPVAEAEPIEAAAGARAAGNTIAPAVSDAEQATLDAMPKGNAAPAAATVAAKPTLSAAEAGEYLKLRQMGKTDAQAKTALEAMRAMLANGAMTDAEVGSALDARYTRGEKSVRKP